MVAKDQAIGKLVNLLQQCDTASVTRLTQQVEDSIELGPWGICQFSVREESSL